MKSLKCNSRENIANKVLVQYRIFNNKAPIVITFSPAGYVLSDKDIINGKNGWGFSCLEKMNVNVITFTAINNKHWFVIPEVQEYINKLIPHLEVFPERLGYGASMGAFALSIYATKLKIDRLLLITPMNLPPSIYSEIKFDYASNFNGEITLIYDPLCPVDKQCALQFPKHTKYLRFYSVGHQVIESLSYIRYLSTLVSKFIDNKIDITEFSSHARKRKNLGRFYSYLKRNPTRKNTKKRKITILYHFLKWNIMNPGASINRTIFKLKRSAEKRYSKLSS
ncbi:hypothetical protein DS885_13320 [Psychromonas sp. B3M02]|uniref:hypothetical protein n=1 Tax=Psychromonas sp. B3M02 TaxID=2267226 RepID=UPI000DEBF2D5|nr:hypothetical protein [Psychromonas sp. B3M02]RBW43460.1 hypothetical protein DS885_13320 [Psychromonas sp. B3M02]